MFAWVSSWNSSWRTSPLPNKWYSPFHQCGQTNECASKLECINKLFLCLSFFFFSCLCSFFRWLSRLLTQKSWEDLHHKWPMTMGIWLSRAEWPQLQQNQKRSAVFRPLYSLYTVASTWVFFYCRECNKFQSKGTRGIHLTRLQHHACSHRQMRYFPCMIRQSTDFKPLGNVFPFKYFCHDSKTNAVNVFPLPLLP